MSEPMDFSFEDFLETDSFPDGMGWSEPLETASAVQPIVHGEVSPANNAR